MANEPIFGNGKICYIEIPADDIQVSAAFFEKNIWLAYPAG
ncbi:VOC family protein [Mucilaginibacter dorajii]|nr:hypothetical protein [Mucilaginibacter dorajii]